MNNEYCFQVGAIQPQRFVFIIFGAYALVYSFTLHAAELGRLFFTPQERVHLKQALTGKNIQGNTISTVTVNGIVQRHNGPRTEWINGVPQNVGTTNGKSPDSLSVTLPGNPRPIKLKVGEELKSTQPAQHILPEVALKKKFHQHLSNQPCDHHILPRFALLCRTSSMVPR